MLQEKIKESESDKTLGITLGKPHSDGHEKKQEDTKHATQYARGIDPASVEKELRATIEGEVRFDEGSKALYATDASNYRQVPIGVVIPANEQDIINTVAICSKAGAPVMARGGGTSLAGQCCNVAVVMDMSKYYNKILDWDKERKTVTVQTGIVLDSMRHATEREIGLTFGPDPATHDHCTIGGMLGNNSCGVHSVMAQFEGNGARTSDNVESLTILTYDGLRMKVGATSDAGLERIIREGGRRGEIYGKLKAFINKYAPLIRERFPNIPRRVSGYNLPELLPENGFNVARVLVGSENTLVTILEATLKLLKNPEHRTLLVLGYKDIYEAGNHVPEILKFKPIGLEGIDDILISYMHKKGLNLKDLPLLPEGKGWLMVEFGGASKEEADNRAKELMKALDGVQDKPSMSLFDNPEQEKMLWEIRESGLGATAWVPGEPMSVPGWEDSAVDPSNVGKYLKDLRDLFHKYGYNPSLYGHFGQGCIHCRVQFDLFTKEGLEKYREFTVEAAHLVVKYGGSISGEHGDGQARGDLLEIMYGKELVQAFKEFKEIWDPQWKMNPGKIINTYGQLSNLRLDNHYNPPAVKTHFSFAEDNNSFAQATIRCVGVGECRKKEGGTMCPSYMVTREEKHSTRGRAHVLFEMLEGDVLKGGWQDEHVKDALDLCLSCKGCKGDCPVNVDMAMYKSEFLSHYYEKKLRPASAYAFGWINKWAQAASVAPMVANFFMRAPVISNAIKGIAGISQKRNLPEFAQITFRQWFKNRKTSNATTNKQRVILWTDTFNNHFKPETLVAATNVLEAAGFDVVIPRKHLCCGRPLYDYGMLNMAKSMLHDILGSLKNHIENGIPVVGLEPSCVSVLRDELTALLPDSQDAKRLRSNTFTLPEFLEKYAPDYKAPELKQKALLHTHCHHKAVMKTEPEQRLLKNMGVDFKLLDSGCCGMAGGFGYEKGDHYDVSIAAGERVLLPAVRDASPDIIIITDGFSCREQIEQETDRQGMHIAQVLDMALQEQGNGKPIVMPEQKYVTGKKLKDPAASVKTLIVTGLVVAGISAVLMRRRSD
jgi:FAD/FMN-containing dehydrogenase/Fe-S oxidoreductase